MTTFPAIRIEGGLLGPEILDQLFAAELPGQRPADFRLDARRNLIDEIASAFGDARALWGVFQNRLERLPETDLATTATRDFWAVPFFRLLGYEPRYNPRAYEVDGLSFAVSYRADEADDAPPVHIVGAGQKLGRVPASGRPRLAPHSLVQEYLNRADYPWGVVTNGLTLRLLRNSTFIRRQAYVEFDLQSVLEEQRFNDFTTLYRLLHRTRLPHGIDDGQCLLEQYYARSLDQGGRVREHLRDGVEECIQRLANGFLRHPVNEALRQQVSPNGSGARHITAEDLYRQLLRLVYRLLFLLVTEDRGLLSPDPIYHSHYSIGRLRRLLDQRASSTNHDDVWQSLRVLWRVLSDEKLAAMLRLAPLNGELFAPQDLDLCTITNRDLLEAFWYLAWYQERSAPPRRVNYTALDAEELGSVYESLLDFHPVVGADGAGRPIFQLIEGSERKTTGSYYTPPELVGELVKSALDPVVADRLSGIPVSERQNALLAIRVCDPACGSGHFLLAAARRMGKKLAQLSTSEEEPAPERVREATRDVIAHCIYGVDKNPLAVDLCRVALWLESHTGDKPLTFLDHRIRCGDSLVGVSDLGTLKDGIPNEAFRPLEGDDKETARALLRESRAELAGQRDFFAWEPSAKLAELTQTSRLIDTIGDDTPEAVRRKKLLFEQSHADLSWQRQQEACDLWTATFFQPLRADQPAITSGVLADHLAGRSAQPRLKALALDLAAEHRFFHWPLEFPEVFAEGGFDVVLCNPPWERVKLQEQEFFAVHDARIANAPTKAARARLIKELSETNPVLYQRFIEALRGASGASSILRHGGRFPLTGRGDINTYAVFAELAATAINPAGRAGLILPTGIATDETTKLFFGSLVQTQRLVDLIGFENEDHIFSAVDHRVKFCKMTIAGVGEPYGQARIAFYIRRFSELAEEHRFFSLTQGDFLLLSPNTGNCPVFRTQADAELTKAIYRRVPVLWRDPDEDHPEANPWRLSFRTLFHMANDSHYFRTPAELAADGYRLEGNIFVGSYDRYLPLYEAKMVHQFDHRFSTYEGASEKQLNVGILPQPSAAQKCAPMFAVQPRYWVRAEVVESAIPQYPEPLAAALRAAHRESVRSVLALWGAGFHLNRNHREKALHLLEVATSSGVERDLAIAFSELRIEDVAIALEQDFPLSGMDAKAIADELDEPESLARDLVARFSPKWFVGWRDICRSNDERTLIASAIPRVSVGHTFPLAFCRGTRPEAVSALISTLDSFVADYAARQKVGGTHITYTLLKQFPILGPDVFNSPAKFAGDDLVVRWLVPRVLELIYTSYDLAPLALDCGYDGPPFRWDDARRFAIRCELDAALFHLYLPAQPDGGWRRAEDEALEQLNALERHFPKPRDAVGHILEQFPIVRQKDEKAVGSYRTKDSILDIYDAMAAAQRLGRAYETSLDPAPGTPAAP